MDKQIVYMLQRRIKDERYSGANAIMGIYSSAEVALEDIQTIYRGELEMKSPYNLTHGAFYEGVYGSWYFTLSAIQVDEDVEKHKLMYAPPPPKPMIVDGTAR